MATFKKQWNEMLAFCGACLLYIVCLGIVTKIALAMPIIHAFYESIEGLKVR
jgi:hypothetical protein